MTGTVCIDKDNSNAIQKNDLSSFRFSPGTAPPFEGEGIAFKQSPRESPIKSADCSFTDLNSSVTGLNSSVAGIQEEEEEEVQEIPEVIAAREAVVIAQEQVCEVNIAK